MKDGRSPLKSKPLRSPGQSCEDALRAILLDKVLIPWVLAIFMGVLTLVELWRAWWNLPPTPGIWAIFAAGSIAFAGYRLKVYLPQIRNLKQARDGERAVGQFLDRLRSQGYEIFHDVPGQHFNVDHLVIGPAGAYSIETKTWTKPRRGRAEVTFDGGGLLRNGRMPDRDPVAQAKAQASWVSRMIEEGSGWKLRVHPVILIPGWWIEQPPTFRSEFWVLEPKAFPRFLEQEPNRLEAEQIRVVAYQVSRYVRTVAESSLVTDG